MLWNKALTFKHVVCDFFLQRLYMPKARLADFQMLVRISSWKPMLYSITGPNNFSYDAQAFYLVPISHFPTSSAESFDNYYIVFSDCLASSIKKGFIFIFQYGCICICLYQRKRNFKRTGEDYFYCIYKCNEPPKRVNKKNLKNNF